VRADDEQALRLRWGGVVRELVEYEAAQRRVVLPATEDIPGATGLDEVRRRGQELADRLGEHDAFTPDDVSVQNIAEVAELAGQQLRAVDAVVLPLLAQLPSDHRMRFGEDLRQVMG
jgi:hypothetical protein